MRSTKLPFSGVGETSRLPPMSRILWHGPRQNERFFSSASLFLLGERRATGEITKFTCGGLEGRERRDLCISSRAGEDHCEAGFRDFGLRQLRQ